MSPPNPPPQLMKLREAKPLGMFHYHDRGVRYVNPHFNDGRGDQDLNPSLLKFYHDGLFLITFHPTMEQANPKIWEDFLLKVSRHLCGVLEIQLFRLFHQGIDNESLATFSYLLLNDSINFSPCGLHKNSGLDRHSSRWHLIND